MNKFDHPPQFANTEFDLVAIATSAGGVLALIQLVADLPADFPAAIAVVLHLEPRRPSLMADILNRRSQLPVKQAAAGDRLQPGHIYLAPPAHHLLVTADGQFCLSQSHPVHFLRPAADLLFESVADHYGKRAIAVVLTGTGSDGAAGAQAIKAKGGIVIAQDQETSEYFSMPSTTIQTGVVDWIVPLPKLAEVLGKLVHLEMPAVDV